MSRPLKTEVREFLRARNHFFLEPAIADPPGRMSRDWWLVGLLIAVAVVEGVVNTPLIWRPWLSVVTILVIPSLLWRRTHPLLALVAVFVPLHAMTVAAAIFAEIPEGPYTAAFVLINIYALFRWGSGRQGAIGLVIMVASFALNVALDWGGIGETIGGALVLLAPAEAGGLMRYHRRNREQAENEVRSEERVQIARELHDSVAHHVSAIAIQAQAGRAVADTDPAAAAHALALIEEAAARTLGEMRAMVGSLRGHGDAELAPQPGIREISSFAGTVGGLAVQVQAPPSSEVPVAVGTALYRITQESVTNAVRHARGASLVQVQIRRVGDRFELTVSDNGRVNGADVGRNGQGYGLIGMAERARLLGGTLHAGPSRSGGWLVEADLPARSTS